MRGGSSGVEGGLVSNVGVDPGLRRVLSKMHFFFSKKSKKPFQNSLTWTVFYRTKFL